MNRREILKGSVELAVLGLLEHKEKHGYKIGREIEAEGGAALAIGPGTLYPLLRRLNAAGFVKSRWEKGTGRRKIRVYGITPEGRKELKARRSYWAHVTTVVNRLIGSTS